MDLRRRGRDKVITGWGRFFCVERDKVDFRFIVDVSVNFRWNNKKKKLKLLEENNKRMFYDNGERKI